MKTDRRTLALENRRISIRTELLTDQMVSQAGLTASQAHMLFSVSYTHLEVLLPALDPEVELPPLLEEQATRLRDRAAARASASAFFITILLCLTI